MIPDWMDLVVWGHEHESRIEAVESVGTFRVVQPGSSVAHELGRGGERREEGRGAGDCRERVPREAGEACQRPSGGSRLKPVDLNDPDNGLDVEVTNLLEMRVKELIQEARDGMVEQEDESATMKVSEANRSKTHKFATSNQLKTLFRRRRSSRRSTSRNLNRKRIIPKKGTTKSSKESRSTRSCSR